MNKKAKIAVLVLSIALIVSVVGMSFAIWDNKIATSDTLSLTVGEGINLQVVDTVLVDNKDLKFAPVGSNDVTKAVVTMKLGTFTLRTTTPSSNGGGSVAVDVKATITIKTNESTPVDLSNYIDVYVVSKANFDSYNNSTTTNIVSALDENNLIAHTYSGIEYGVLAVWKADYINNPKDANVVKAVGDKGIKVSIKFDALEKVSAGV